MLGIELGVRLLALKLTGRKSHRGGALCRGKNDLKPSIRGSIYIEGKAAGRDEVERIYYIMYRRGSRLIEEKAGRQFQDDMTAGSCRTGPGGPHSG